MKALRAARADNRGGNSAGGAGGALGGGQGGDGGSAGGHAEQSAQLGKKGARAGVAITSQPARMVLLMHVGRMRTRLWPVTGRGSLVITTGTLGATDGGGVARRAGARSRSRSSARPRGNGNVLTDSDRAIVRAR
eukprot:5973429-Prymnesium_polylepis.4